MLKTRRPHMFKRTKNKKNPVFLCFPISNLLAVRDTLYVSRPLRGAISWMFAKTTDHEWVEGWETNRSLGTKSFKWCFLLKESPISWIFMTEKIQGYKTKICQAEIESFIVIW